MSTSNNKSQDNSLKKKREFSFLETNLIAQSTFKILGNCKKAIFEHKKIGLIIGAIILVLIISAVIVSSSTTSDDKTTSFKSAHHGQSGDSIDQRLQDISDQLTTIRSHLSSGGTISLDSINQQLQSLGSDLKQLSSDSNKLIGDEITSSTAELQKELVHVNAQIKKLEELEHHVKYLNPSDLPFQVIAVDNIQQNEVVTINYNHASFPVEIGGYIASWKLIAADFVSQKAEFINAKKQHVVIDLNRVEEAKH